MEKSLMISFVVMAAIAITGCHSAKPTVAYEAVADSVAVSAESLTYTILDSIAISEKMRIIVKDTVEFVEEGGSVYVSADGSVILSGVASVKSSRQAASAERKDRKSLTEQSKSRDSIAAVHQSSYYSETKPAVSTDRSSRIVKYSAYLFGFVVILIIMRKLRQTVINHS